MYIICIMYTANISYVRILLCEDDVAGGVAVRGNAADYIYICIYMYIYNIYVYSILTCEDDVAGGVAVRGNAADRRGRAAR